MSVCPLDAILAQSAPTETAEAKVDLTIFSSGFGGCSCKLRPLALHDALQMQKIKQINDPQLMMGFQTSDDCSVYKLTDDIAMVQSTDFFPALVAEPFLFGRIAAANALSDIYAMGSVPKTALAICAFPSTKLHLRHLAEILDGATQVCREAGIAIAGGHTLEQDPLFGLAVTGIVHPDEVWTNGGAKEGDHLVLTKAIGTGVATKSAKLLAPAESPLLDAATESMARLNRHAMEAGRACGHVHSCTDITGFGLAVHTLEMARASNLVAHIHLPSLPVLPHAEDILREHRGAVVLGAAHTNAQFCGDALKIAASAQDPSMHPRCCLVADPQTSGGLLLSVGPEGLEKLMSELKERGIEAADIGVMAAGTPAVVLSGDGPVVQDPVAQFAIPFAHVSVADATAPAAVAPAAAPAAPNFEGKVLLLTRPHMGDDSPLGRKLIRGLLALMAAGKTLPATIFMANTGVDLVYGEDKQTQSALGKLAERGVDVVSCVTCVKDLGYDLTNPPVVGRIGTAAESLAYIMGNHPYLTLS